MKLKQKGVYKVASKRLERAKRKAHHKGRTRAELGLSSSKPKRSLGWGEWDDEVGEAYDKGKVEGGSIREARKKNKK